MKREDIFEVLQASVLILDGGTPQNYGINPEFATMGKKLIDYLTKLEASQ